MISCYNIKHQMMLAEMQVAPFAGAWIEIAVPKLYSVALYVAPFAGTE